LIHGFGGSNREIKNAVMCYEFDSTNPPEGIEYSAFTAQWRSGTNFDIPADQLSYWQNELCVSLGTHKSGDSGTYRYTVTAVEADMQSGADITNIRFDDLGNYRGRDVTPNRGTDTVTAFLRN